MIFWIKRCQHNQQSHGWASEKKIMLFSASIMKNVIDYFFTKDVFIIMLLITVLMLVNKNKSQHLSLKVDQNVIVIWIYSIHNQKQIEQKELPVSDHIQHSSKLCTFFNKINKNTSDKKTSDVIKIEKNSMLLTKCWQYNFSFFFISNVFN